MSTVESLKMELEKMKAELEAVRAHFDIERKTLKKQIQCQAEMISVLRVHVSPILLALLELKNIDDVPQVRIGTVLFDSNTSPCDGESFHALVDGKGPTISLIICKDFSVVIFAFSSWKLGENVSDNRSLIVFKRRKEIKLYPSLKKGNELINLPLWGPCLGTTSDNCYEIGVLFPFNGKPKLWTSPNGNNFSFGNEVEEGYTEIERIITSTML